MDDLHPDSNDAEIGKLQSNETGDATETQVAHPADSAATQDDTAPEQQPSDEPGGQVSESAAENADNLATSEATQAASQDAAPEQGQEQMSAPDELAETHEPDADDVPSVSEYSTIHELGRDGWGRILLAWRIGAPTPDDQEPPVVLLERSALDVETAQRVVDFHLYHARLLAPRAVVPRDGNIHWLVVEAPATYEAPFVAVNDGGRLDPRSALKAGVGLANALAYLHTNGVAHGHVGPNAVLVHDGRAYLSGVETSAPVETTEQAGATLVAADVNALARVLPQLAALPDEAPADEAGSAQAIRAIAARGGGTGFVTAEELAQECGQALQEPALTLPAAPESASRPLVFHCGTATTVGLLRSQNQDALGCTVIDIRDDIGKDLPIGIFLVADGMGGEAAGEIASRIGARIAMAEVVRQLLVPTVAMPGLEPFSPEHMSGTVTVQMLAQALAIAVDAANRQVRALAAALQESTGTTLTAIVVAGGRAVLAHLGDSRAYLLRDNTLVQLTKDHSLLARLLELDHPLLNDPSFGMPRNYLYRSLGQEDEAPPDMMEFPVVPGDRLLICSDGLWDELDDVAIQRCLTSTDDPAECANHLVRLANAAGGHDNSTAVVVFVEAQHDDPASEISPEEADAILRAAGVLDEGDNEDEDDGNDHQLDHASAVDDAFNMGLN